MFISDATGFELVIGIAGHARSGKSTLADALSQRLGISVVSFGREVRAIAAERNLTQEPGSERETLMRLGEELVSRMPTEFCKRVLAQAGWTPGTSLVVEGIRHRVVLDELRQLVTPTPLFLAFLETPASEREHRLATEGPGGLTLDVIDAHSTERDLDGVLRQEAQVVVSGASPVEESLTQVIHALRSAVWRRQ